MQEIKLLHDVLIHVPEVMQTTKENSEVLIAKEFNNPLNIVRYGTVISTPVLYDTILHPGDIVFFHHNIVRRSMAMDRTIMHNPYEVDRAKGLYNCPPEEIFGIERNGTFTALDPFCFIKPIKNETITKKSGIFMVSGDIEKPNLGIIRYGNEHLKSLGLNDGDKVVFKVDSEYEFHVYGEKLYRMKSNKILGIWNEV